MPHIVLTPNIDDSPWRDLDGAAHGILERVAGIPGGMQSGKPAVGLAVRLESGDWIVAETSWAALHAAVAGLRGRYGEPA